jgi:hypothetical protein
LTKLVLHEVSENRLRRSTSEQALGKSGLSSATQPLTLVGQGTGISFRAWRPLRTPNTVVPDSLLRTKEEVKSRLLSELAQSSVGGVLAELLTALQSCHAREVP